MGLSTGRGYSIKPKYIIQIEDVAKAYRFERGGRGRRASPSLSGDGGVGAELLRAAVAWRGPGASGLQGAVDGSLPSGDRSHRRVHGLLRAPLVGGQVEAAPQDPQSGGWATVTASCNGRCGASMSGLAEKEEDDMEGERSEMRNLLVVVVTAGNGRCKCAAYGRR